MSQQETTPKLTPAQRVLLRYLADHEQGCGTDEAHKPTMRLVALGLATMKEQRFGGHWLKITDAGREVVNGF